MPNGRAARIVGEIIVGRRGHRDRLRHIPVGRQEGQSARQGDRVVVTRAWCDGDVGNRLAGEHHAVGCRRSFRDDQGCGVKRYACLVIVLDRQHQRCGGDHTFAVGRGGHDGERPVRGIPVVVNRCQGDQARACGVARSDGEGGVGGNVHAGPWGSDGYLDGCHPVRAHIDGGRDLAGSTVFFNGGV